MLTVITIGANSYNLVPMPPKPGFADVAFDMNDTVAANVSPFTMWTQTQVWAGADWWTAQVTMPPLSYAGSRAWIAWLAALRGMANVFQLGDPYGQIPQGVAKGQPLVDSSIDTNNLPMTTTLTTRGWAPSIMRQLMPGDYMQIGYRLHIVSLDGGPVNSNASGDAQITVWPSLRETPGDGTPIVLHNTVGLFRLPKNKRSWHASPKTLVNTGFTCLEVR